ncbi:unnamed protein product [Phytophthora fragariaefolia]|uniref:Unnamed protein product n=1 Tax=Phytophthora fragariaefolia TaxID=1490495 RepID=A0A9W6YFK9_9STRA|nr:unnamed protein product [Phytophthora fragariaefolia]
MKPNKSPDLSRLVSTLIGNFVSGVKFPGMGGTGKMVQVAIGEVQGWYQENGTSADQIDTGTRRYRAIRSTSDPDPDRYGAIISSTLSNSASSVGTIISAHRVPPKWYIHDLKSQRSG